MSIKIFVNRFCTLFTAIRQAFTSVNIDKKNELFRPNIIAGKLISMGSL